MKVLFYNPFDVHNNYQQFVAVQILLQFHRTTKKLLEIILRKIHIGVDI